MQESASEAEQSRPSLKQILEGAPVWNQKADDDEEIDIRDEVEIERQKQECLADHQNSYKDVQNEAAVDDEESDDDAPKKKKGGGICASLGNVFSYAKQQEVPDSDSFECEPGEEFVERAKYIPLRLTYEERKQLHLLEAALSVSGYTDKLDTPTFCNKSKRIRTQLQDICAFLSGLVVAVDYKTGQERLADKDFASDADFFQDIFELARRYKIMNPEKLRGDYGKLMYLLQVRILHPLTVSTDGIH